MSDIKALDKLRVSEDAAEYQWIRSDYLNQIADEIEAEISDRYIWLPVDIDGVQVRMGDTVSPYLEDGSYTVERITLYNWGWRVTANGVDADGGECTISVAANCLRHVKTRTVEDILCELEGLRGNGAMYEDVVTRAAVLARELRELLGGDAA